MQGHLISLMILFFVIYDPLLSIPFFLNATKNMGEEERFKTATLAILVASIISIAVLFSGIRLLHLFNTNINDFKVAGGIILGLLGVKMVLGIPITEIEENDSKSISGVAVIIGTPLLSGPAAITTIIISVSDYGLLTTGIAVTVVLVLTGILLYSASKLLRFLGETTIQVSTTMMGLITLAWGVMFVRGGLGI
ncbi:MAG: MarC family protein [Methanocellales archaeon]|nr:MarC family protein [Methanocellales archaeon]MDD4898050.1 MarC family protein [Methanocellales archaeon]MDD5447193.1 MarC family protein [Methanocellales archaeon]